MKHTIVLLASLVGLASPSFVLAQPQATQPAPAQAGQPGTSNLKVASNGREPRFQLRYAPPVGTIDRIELTAHCQQTVSANGVPDNDPLNATMRYIIRAEVSKDTPEEVVLTLEVLSAEGSRIDDAGSHTAKPDYSKAKGATGKLTVAHCGLVEKCELTPKADTPPDAAKAVDDIADLLQRVLLFPLPPEEVGAGASWSITLPADHGQREGQITFKLPAAAKDRFTLQYSCDAPPMNLDVPANGDGTTFKATPSKGTMTCECVMVSTHALPVRSVATLKSSGEVTAEKQGKQVTAKTAVEQTISLKSLQSTPPKKGPDKEPAPKGSS